MISDHELDRLDEENGMKNEPVLIRPESPVLKEKGVADLSVVSDSSHDSDSDLLDMARIDTQPASLPTTPILTTHSSLPSGFYGNWIEVYSALPEACGVSTSIANCYL